MKRKAWFFSSEKETSSDKPIKEGSVLEKEVKEAKENSSEESSEKKLEKFEQENFKSSPSSEKAAAARRNNNAKKAAFWLSGLLILGGITFWVVSSSWTLPVRQVSKIEGNKVTIDGSEYDLSNEKKLSLSASWLWSYKQIRFTINSGFLSGVSFDAWLDKDDNLCIVPDNKDSSAYKFNISEGGYIDVTSGLIAKNDLSLKITKAVKSAGKSSSSPDLLSIFINLLPTILLIILLFILYKSLKSQAGVGGGADSIFGIGKSQAKLAESKVKFTDVAGIEEEKNELVEIVDYLKKPGKYAAMGARAPKGVILYGPPGTGKTLLAKAVAGEANVPFFEVSGSAFEDMLVGVGAKRVRDLFSKASKAAPAIIFIDEIDSVASKRGKNDVVGSSGGIADQTINQLLAEMDGFSTNTGVVVIAATNRLDVLDPAILRPGRFDRHIQINLPDIKERTQILKIHSRNKNISSSVNLEDIARRTPGFSGAQLENVLNEATLLAVRENKNTISLKHLDEAIDRVIAGPAKQTRVITPSEKEQIAYHEAGHALIGLHNPGGDVVQKITIIPRGRAAGYTLSTPEKQELSIQTKENLLSMVCCALGGRAAEEFIYGQDKISTGAANDLYKVTNIVRSMVMQLGMSSLGMTQFIPSEGATNPFASKLYSEQTANLIDKEIDKIITEQYKKATFIIKKNKTELDLIVKSLLILETITKEQIDYIHTNKKLPKEALTKSANKEKGKKNDK